MKKYFFSVFVCLMLLSIVYYSSFADSISKCKISGFVKPEFSIGNKDASPNNKGTRIEVSGTQLSTTTDEKGYFEIKDVPVSSTGYSLKVTRPGFLSRDFDSDIIDGDLQINDEDFPLGIWAGDVMKNGISDGAINLSDVVTLAVAFNSTFGDGKYVSYLDFNMDKSINLSDVILISRHFNAICKDYPRFRPVKPVKPTPVATATPCSSPSLMTLTGSLWWNNLEGGFFVLDTGVVKYDVGSLNNSFDKTKNTPVMVTGYISPNQASIHMYGIVFNVVSIKDLMSPDTTPTNTPIPTVIATPKPTPELKTLYGTSLQWMDFEGGFYVLKATDGEYYDLGRMTNIPNWDGSLAGPILKVTGYIESLYSFHMCGIPFKVVSIEGVNSIPDLGDNGFTKTTPTPVTTPTVAQELGAVTTNPRIF